MSLLRLRLLSALVAVSSALAGGCAPASDRKALSYEELNLALVEEGRRLWSTSPDPGNPVACSTCHFDARSVRSWVASFPKVRPAPQPHSRVVTLLQANASAVRLHYRIDDALAPATALTAFLRAAGGSLPVSPGLAQGQPVIPARIDRLSASAHRGREVFADHCASCHEPGLVAAVAASFPRSHAGVPDSFEWFLERHTGLGWEGSEVAALSADLFARLAGTSLDGWMRQEAARVAGEVRDLNGRPLAGLALLEKGELHSNVWQAGVRVAEDGRFEISVPEGGEYGLHVYSSGYIYSPQSVMLKAGSTAEVKVVMVPQPTRANDPVIAKPVFGPSPAAPRHITWEVTDPNGDLGPQVIAFDAATGRPFAMAPPAPVPDLQANFPNGTYRLEVGPPHSAAQHWFFVVADHQCNTTDVLAAPHEPAKPRVVK